MLGCDPTDPASLFQFRSVSFDDKGWHIRFHPRRQGRAYRLLRAPDIESAVWQPVASASLAAGPDNEGVFTDSAPDPAQTFYRLEVDL